MTEAEITTQIFRPTQGDHIRFLVGNYYRSFGTWPGIALYPAQIVVVPFIINFANLMQGRFSGFLIGLAITSLIWCVAIPALTIVRTAWNFHRNPSLSNMRSIRLNDRSLVVEGPGLFSELTWNNFLKAERGKARTYLYLSVGTAYIIPDSAFASREAADTFLDQARCLIQQSKHDQAAIFEAPVSQTPDQAELKSEPFKYTFALHFKLYPGLFRQGIRPIFFIMVVVIYGFTLSQHGWGLTEADRIDMLPEMVGIPLLFGGLFFLILPLILAPVTWLNVRKQAAVRGTRVAALSDERLVVHGESFHTELRLADLTRVRRTRHLMLFMTQPNCAIVVPLSAFASPEAANLFFQKASAQWQAKRGKPAAKTQLDGKS